MLRRMIKRTIDPSIDVMLGSPATGRDFDGVHSIPAAFIFEKAGREVFRLGGGRGRHYLKQRQLKRVMKKIS